jgi:hypothetical protein
MESVKLFSQPKFHREDFFVPVKKKRKRSTRYAYFRRYLGIDQARYGSTHRCFQKMKVSLNKCICLFLAL